MAQALKEKALEVALLEQEVWQLQLLLELQQALIPNSKPALADTLHQEEDDQDHPVEDPQVEDHHQEDLEVWAAIRPEHQDLLHQYCYSSFDLSSIYAVKYHLTMRIHLYQLSFLISTIPGPRYCFPAFSDLPVI